MFFSSNKNSIEYLIVGLGNPGPKYEQTRHNAGFMAIDRLGEVNKLKYKGLLSECSLNGHRCLLLKPQTFMNNSGESVEAVASFYKIPTARVIVIYDDISLPPGKVRIRRQGSAGGHNGIKSIIECTGEDNFPRIKLGVGSKPHPDYDLADWVLSKFKADDLKALDEPLSHIDDMVGLIVGGKIDEAMNRYNNR